MKKFTKLALVSSLAISANAMAMQAMDDASLGATTGQDGLNIGIGISQISIEKLYVHDNDGLEVAKGGKGQAAAIVIHGKDSTKTSASEGVNPTTAAHGIVIKANYDDGGAHLLNTRNLADLTIDSDANDGNPFINIAAAVSGLDIKIGKIGVVSSAVEGSDSNSIRRGGTGTVNDFFGGVDVKTGKITANIQLGAAPQGAMIQLNTTMMGGLTLSNLSILDNSTKLGTGAGTSAANRAAGEIFIDKIQLADAGSRNLTLNQKVSVIGTDGADKGYIRIISTSGARDNYIKGIHLGSQGAASIGDVEVQGLQTYYGSPAVAGSNYTPGAMLTISAH